MLKGLFLMSRSFLLRFAFLFLLTPLLSACLPEKDTKGQTQAAASPVKLSCFTAFPDAGAIGKKEAEDFPSCDELCGQQEAVCTGVQSHIAPPPSCGDAMFPSYGDCRCCKVTP